MKKMVIRRNLIAMMAMVMMAGTALSGSNVAFAASSQTGTTVVESYDELETFAEMLESNDIDVKDLSKEDKVKLEKLYKEMVKAEKAEKYDDADLKYEEFYKIADKYVKPISFEEFIKDENIDKADLAKAKKLYLEIEKLQKSEKYEAADTKMEELYKLLGYDDLDEAIDDLDETEVKIETFEEFIKNQDIELSKLSKEDKIKSEKLYKEIIEFEKNDKYEESESKWETLDNVLDKYIKPLTFEDFSEGMNIEKTDLAKAKKLYSELLNLEKLDKMDEAQTKWDELEKLMNFEEEDCNS